MQNCQRRGLDSLRLVRPGVAVPVSRYLAVRTGRLLTVRPLRAFMITTRVDIAHSDCLFYLADAEAEDPL